MATTRCAKCDREFEVKRAKLKDRNFCSHVCYWADKRKTVYVECKYCSTILERNPCHIKKSGENQFCNIECRDLHWKGSHPNSVEYPDKHCLICNVLIPRQIAKRRYAKYCSLECKAKGRTGELSKNWKGGIWVYQGGWGTIAKRYKERVDYTCEHCKEKKSGKSIHVHHIDGGKKNHDITNLIALCVKCHRGVHAKKIEVKPKRRTQTGDIYGG